MKNELFKFGNHTLFKVLFSTLLFLVTTLSLANSRLEQNTYNLYKANCAQCHSEYRIGGVGPALLPESLQRLDKTSAKNVIRNGRVMTAMPAFKNKLTDKEIQLLVDFIYTPLEKIPIWGMQQIKASHIVHTIENSVVNKPVFTVKDYLNLFLVVEKGDNHITLLDGDSFKPVHRFKSRFALYGGLKFSPSGRYVYSVSRDGWISKYDIYNLKMVAEIRAGINTRNLAISADGRYILVANYLPHTMVLLSTKDLGLIKLYNVKSNEGKTSRVSAVYTAPKRSSFFAALKDIPELWEISYADEPPAGFGMWIHDYRADSGEDTTPESFPLRRISVENYLDNFYLDKESIVIAGVTAEWKGQVVDMDVRKVVVPGIDLPGKPHFGAALSLDYKGRQVLLVPNTRAGIVSVLDMETWKVVKQIKTLGPGFFMRTHKNSPYLWLDVFPGANKDVMHVIDKHSLEIIKTFRPAPGKRSAHVEFSRNGKYALISIWEREGSVIVYDATTLKEIKRIPMTKPSGKYNVYNRTRYAEP